MFRDAAVLRACLDFGVPSLRRKHEVSLFDRPIPSVRKGLDASVSKFSAALDLEAIVCLPAG